MAFLVNTFFCRKVQVLRYLSSVSIQCKFKNGNNRRAAVAANRKYLLQQSKLPPKHSYVSKTSNHNSEKRTQDELPITVPATTGSAPAYRSGPFLSSANGSSPDNQSSLSVPATIGSAPINQSCPPTCMPSTTGSSPVNKTGPSVPLTFGSSTVDQSSLSVPSTVGCAPGLPGNLSPSLSKGSASKDKHKESGWEEEYRSLRRKLRKFEERIEVLERSASDTTNTPDDKQKAKDLVAHLAATDHNSVLQTLSRFIFTEGELRNCSRTGKKKTIKCASDPRPPLDQEKFNKLKRLVITKTSMPKETFLKKFENFQKVLRIK